MCININKSSLSSMIVCFQWRKYTLIDRVKKPASPVQLYSMITTLFHHHNCTLPSQLDSTITTWLKLHHNSTHLHRHDFTLHVLSQLNSTPLFHHNSTQLDSTNTTKLYQHNYTPPSQLNSTITTRLNSTLPSQLDSTVTTVLYHHNSTPPSQLHSSRLYQHNQITTQLNSTVTTIL